MSKRPRQRPELPASMSPWAAIKLAESAFGMSSVRNASSTLGRLLEAGLLTRDHLDAGDAFLRLRRSIVGREHATPLTVIPTRRGSRTLSDEDAERIEALYRQAVAAIPRSALPVITRVVMGETDDRASPLPLADVTRLQRALTALAEVFEAAR